MNLVTSIVGQKYRQWVTSVRYSQAVSGCASFIRHYALRAGFNL